MLDGIPTTLNLGLGGLVVILVLLFAIGKIPTLRELRDVQADRDHYRQVADDTLAMATKLSMSVEKLTVSVEQLNTSAATSNHALREIQRAVTEHRP